MLIREEIEKWENDFLSEFATKAVSTKGRERFEEKCDIRTDFQRDRDRIIHSKSFRRLKHKTQVFLAPSGDHYRTRLTHTLEVSQIARTIAKALFLNEDLTEAIALGHDLGHTPFGHAGEKALNEMYCFTHFEQSLRIVEVLEKEGRGLNLTWEVKDGILNHKTSGHPSTLEGKIVRASDKIAYINHDIDDAIRAGILKESDLPKDITDELGHSTRERLNTLIHSVVENSIGLNDIRMNQHTFDTMSRLREFMFGTVYSNNVAKAEEGKAEEMLKALFEYFVKNKDKLPKDLLRINEERNEPLERAVCDYIAGMSDQYSVSIYQQIFVPMFWEG